MGYTLTVWYARSEKIPQQLFKVNFLWNINEQGYKEMEDKGYGYFWDREKIARFFDTVFSLQTEQIIALHYNAYSRILED